MRGKRWWIGGQTIVWRHTGKWINNELLVVFSLLQRVSRSKLIASSIQSMKKKEKPSNYGAPFLVTTRPTFPDDGSQLRTSFVLQHIAKARCSCPSFNGFRQPTRNMQLHPPGKPATWSTVQRRPARAALSSPSLPVLTARNKVNSNNQLSQTVGSETDLTGDGDTELTQPPSLKQPRRNDTSGGN